MVYKFFKNVKGEIKIREVLLSVFGSLIKSGFIYLRLYVMVNNFYCSSLYNVFLFKIKEVII